MNPWQELRGVNERQVLEFFYVGLLDVSDPGVDKQQLMYNASILAHFAQVSTTSSTDFPAPTSLLRVFDQFVLDETVVGGDTQLLETAAAQCLLLAGFFEDQARRRHNVQWYASLGASFFSRAAARERSPKKSTLLNSLSRHFEPWRRRHARLGRELRDQYYLLPKWEG